MRTARRTRTPLYLRGFAPSNNCTYNCSPWSISAIRCRRGYLWLTTVLLNRL